MSANEVTLRQMQAQLQNWIDDCKHDQSQDWCDDKRRLDLWQALTLLRTAEQAVSELCRADAKHGQWNNIRKY